MPPSTRHRRSSGRFPFLCCFLILSGSRAKPLVEGDKASKIKISLRYKSAAFHAAGRLCDRAEMRFLSFYICEPRGRIEKPPYRAFLCNFLHARRKLSPYHGLWFYRHLIFLSLSRLWRQLPRQREPFLLLSSADGCHLPRGERPSPTVAENMKKYHLAIKQKPPAKQEVLNLFFGCFVFRLYIDNVNINMADCAARHILDLFLNVCLNLLSNIRNLGVFLDGDKDV